MPAQPRFIRRHGEERIASEFRQTSGQAGIEPGNGEVALVAALVARKRIDGHADEPAFAAHFVEKDFVGRPDSREPPSLTVTPSLVPRLHMIGTFSAASGKVCALIVARSGLPSAVARRSAATRRRHDPDAAAPFRPPNDRRRCVPKEPTALSPTRDGPISPRDRQDTSETRRQSHSADRTTSGSRPFPAARRPEPAARSHVSSPMLANAGRKRPVSPDQHA